MVLRSVLRAPIVSSSVGGGVNTSSASQPVINHSSETFLQSVTSQHPPPPLTCAGTPQWTLQFSVICNFTHDGGAGDGSRCWQKAGWMMSNAPLSRCPVDYLVMAKPPSSLSSPVSPASPVISCDLLCLLCVEVRSWVLLVRAPCSWLSDCPRSCKVAAAWHAIVSTKFPAAQDIDMTNVKSVPVLHLPPSPLPYPSSLRNTLPILHFWINHEAESSIYDVEDTDNIAPCQAKGQLRRWKLVCQHEIWKEKTTIVIMLRESFIK